MAFGIKTVGGGNVGFDVVPTATNTVVTIDNVSGIPVYGDSVTGALILPSGTTAQRTASPSVGAIRQNITLGITEIWNGYNWGDVSGKLPSTYRTQRSLRFRGSASAYLSRTNTSSVINNAVWTWSAWVKFGTLTGSNAIVLFGTGSPGSTDECTIKFQNNQLEVINYVSSNVQARRITSAVYRDPSAWHHIVVSSNSSTALNIYVNGVQVTSFATSVGPSAAAWALNSASVTTRTGAPLGGAFQYFDGYLTEINFIDGQALDASYFGETDVISGSWIPKAYTGTYGTNGFYLPFTNTSSVAALGYNAALVDFEADKFSDVFTNVTETNNGDGTWRWAFGNVTSIMRLSNLATLTGNVDVTFRVKLVSGTVSSFPIDYGDGTGVDIKNDLVTGQWVTVTKTLSAGASGFLDFPSNVNLNGVTIDVDYVLISRQNDWTPNNISLTAGVTYDSMLDVPTLTSATVANYATLNPLKNDTTLSNANLNFAAPTLSVKYSTGTIAAKSGKYYFEHSATAIAPQASIAYSVGVGKTSISISSPSNSDYYLYNNNGSKSGGGSGAVAYGASFVVGDIVGVALNMDAGTITFYKNNVSQGIAFSGLTGLELSAFVSIYSDSPNTTSGYVNFGQRPFSFTPPTGYLAMNTYNLP